MNILPSDICLSRLNKLPLLQRYVLDETVIAARADLNITNALIRDHDVCGIPKRQTRQVVADDLPSLSVKLFGLFTIGCGYIDRLFDKAVDLRIAVTAAVTTGRPGHAGYL